MDDLKRWAKPTRVDGPAAAFGADGAALTRLLPPMSVIPEAFRDERDPWCAVAQRWFFSGLTAGTLRALDGIDQTAALSHLAAVLRSFAPKHEHKMAGAAWLMSQWFHPATAPSQVPA